jgi:hypothetical protein
MGVKSDAALAGAAGVAVLDAESFENFVAAVVHADRDEEVVLPKGVPEQISGCLIQSELFGRGVELLLGHREGVEGFLHGFPPMIAEKD